MRRHPARAGGGCQLASFAGFLTVLAQRQGRGQVAAAERPGNAREVARFCGELGKRPVPGRSPPPNRPPKDRFSSQLQAIYLGGASHLHATLMRPRSHPKAISNPSQSPGAENNCLPRALAVMRIAATPQPPAFMNSSCFSPANADTTWQTNSFFVLTLANAPLRKALQRHWPPLRNGRT